MPCLHFLLRPAQTRLALAAVAGLLILPWMASAQNSLIWRTNFYTVSGQSVRELRQSMRQARPWQDNTETVGLTQWRIDWRFDLKPTANGCRCASFTTTTSITNTLPRWTTATNATPDVRADWNRFVTSLGQHEDGHTRMAFAAVAELHKRVKEVGEESDCDRLKKKINDLALRVVDDFRARDREYDRRTNHGATQGAGLR